MQDLYFRKKTRKHLRMSKKVCTFAADLNKYSRQYMGRNIFSTAVLVLLSVFTPACCAATIVHNFSSTTGRYFGEGNTSCTINSDTVYTCTGSGAVFASYGGSKITLYMKEKDDCVTISPAIENLTEMKIYYSRTAPLDEYHIEVYISTDNGSSWTKLPASRLSDSRSWYVKVLVPKNNNMVRIVHTDDTEIAISQIEYSTSDCNCFPYFPE